MKRWSQPTPCYAPVYKRFDGAAIHCGGLVMAPGVTAVMAYRHDPELWARCAAREPKTRRALMLFVDTAWPPTDPRTP